MKCHTIQKKGKIGGDSLPMHIYGVDDSGEYRLPVRYPRGDGERRKISIEESSLRGLEQRNASEFIVVVLHWGLYMD